MVACAPASSQLILPGTVTGGPSGGPARCMSPLIACDTNGEARQWRYGPVRPNGVIAHTIVSSAIHENAPAAGS